MGRFIPRGAEQRAGRTKAAWHVFLTCCLFFAAPVGVFAQGGDTIRTFWVPTQDFTIPFTPAADPGIVEVLLYVSTDKGQSYQYVATESPTARRFKFPMKTEQARGDGWYFFIVQTRDRNNVYTPADVRGLPPSIRVCVDTQKPIISLLRAVPAQDGSPAAIEWSIQDANFDDIHAEYRSVAGGPWIPLLDLPRTATGVYGWTPRVAGDVEVVLQARDKAKHTAEPRSAIVKPGAVRPGAAPPPSPGDVKHVKNKTFQLDYQLDDSTVGPSDVKNVDIWKMRQGGPWQKCREPGPAKGPATVTVDAPGRWGFRLIPRSGVGLAEPDPRPGDQPDLWIQVDDQAPVVKITNVVVSPGADSGRMTVFWTASDPFLSRQPITISYSPIDREEWKEIDKSENSGSFTCEPQKIGLPYQFRLKVQAVDEAGNVGEDKWRETIKVDLKVPRIKHIEVKPSGAGEQTQASPQSPPFSTSSRQPPLPKPAGLDFSNPNGP